MITFFAVVGLVFTVIGALLTDVLSTVLAADANAGVKFGLGWDWIDHVQVWGLLIASCLLWALAIWQILHWAGVA